MRTIYALPKRPSTDIFISVKEKVFLRYKAPLNPTLLMAYHSKVIPFYVCLIPKCNYFNQV